jgi:predicted nucleic acid-binding protein
MKKLKIYLDTSVYSALYDERDLIRQNQTKEFWDSIKDHDSIIQT